MSIFGYIYCGPKCKCKEPQVTVGASCTAASRASIAATKPPWAPRSRDVTSRAGFENLHRAEFPPSMDILLWVVRLVPQPRAAAETPGLGLPRAPRLVVLNSDHFKTTAGFDLGALLQTHEVLKLLWPTCVSARCVRESCQGQPKYGERGTQLGSKPPGIKESNCLNPSSG